MGNMLPFSGVDFFILIFGFILILHLFKNILNKIISYKNILFIAIILYIIGIIWFQKKTCHYKIIIRNLW